MNNNIFSRGTEQIYPNRENLEKALNNSLKQKKDFVVYLGIDPTGPDLHLGHAIAVRKLAEFQKIGCKTILLIGDFTAMIGDPSGKHSTRKQLSKQQVEKNQKNYYQQIKKIINLDGLNKTKIVFNSEWFGKFNLQKTLELASNFTAQQMIERDMFQERIKAGKPIFLHEFFYPLLQAYDSIEINADLEIGGSDQIFNMMMGRDLAKILKNKEKFVLSIKLLVDSNGKKMGKTENNMVKLSDNPKEMFGKIMAFTDGLIIPGFELLTDVPLEDVDKMKFEMPEKLNPRDAKAKLAKEIIKIFYSEKEANQAEESFNNIFRDKNLPIEMPEKIINKPQITLLDLVSNSGFVQSRSEARRLILDNAIKIGNEKKCDPFEIIDITKSAVSKNRNTNSRRSFSLVLRKGSKNFIKIIYND